MQKNFKIIAVIVIIGLGFSFWIFYEPQQQRYQEKLVKEAQSKMDIFEFGKDKGVDDIIYFKAKSKNWNFVAEHGLELISTGNVRAPFITSVDYLFADPNNKDVNRMLSETYIYDGDHNDWVPITSNLDEFSNGKIKNIETSQIWQGGFDIPFFDDSFSSELFRSSTSTKSDIPQIIIK